MEKKITVYIVALSDIVKAIPADDVKENDGVFVVKNSVTVEGVPFTSKRQALEAVALTGKFGLETLVVSQKRTVKLA